MTTQDTHPTVQAVRRVYENQHSINSSTTPTETIYLVCHSDPSLGKDILLWDDILVAFKDDVVHVRSGAVVLPFLKGSDFKNLDPLRIAAIPGVTLDIVVRAQLGTAKELSLEALQQALPDTPQENNKNNSNSHSAATVAAIATAAGRSPVGGLVEEAMQNYTHIDYPANLLPRRGPQTILDEQAAAPKAAATDMQKTHATINSSSSSNSSNSDSRAGAPQELSSSLTTDFAEAMMKARLGDKDAQCAVGASYRNGQGVQQDYQSAMDWYLKAAEQGHAGSQYEVGCLYQDGLGVAQSYSKAMEWYQKAGEQGNAAAQSNIGYLHENGLGVPEDYSRAMEWYQKAAEQGHAPAQSNIGVLYQDGLGVAQDNSKAMEWYQKAGEQGNAAAQSNIGYLYQNGLGVAQDSSKGMEWYQKAAEQGYAVAQFNIGFLYEYGQGVQKDKSKAMEWYKKAADGGETDAKEAFDKLERQGDDSVVGGDDYGAAKKKQGFLKRIFN